MPAHDLGFRSVLGFLMSQLVNSGKEENARGAGTVKKQRKSNGLLNLYGFFILIAQQLHHAVAGLLFSK